MLGCLLPRLDGIAAERGVGGVGGVGGLVGEACECGVRLGVVGGLGGVGGVLGDDMAVLVVG